MNKLPLHEPCPCGSGKEYGQCCGRVNGFQLLYFHRGKRSHYGALIEKCIGDLLKYAKRYFVNWDVKARAKFLAASQAQEVTQQFIPVFWEWYVVDYRPFKDVSPLIDFYLAENEDAITQQEKSLYTSLKNSHLSIYQVLWVQTNTVAIRDIFTNEESILERDFGSVTRLVEEGSLLLSRIIIINGVPIITGNPVFVYSEQKGYLYEEINSIRIYEKEDDIQAFLREQGHTICSFVMDLLNGIKKNQVKTRSFRLNEIDRKNVIEQIFHNSFFCLIDPNEPLLKFTWNQEEDRFKRLYLERNLLIVSAEDSEDLCLAINELSNMLGYKWDNGEMEDVWIYGVVTEDEEQTEEIQTEILFDRHLEEWLTLPHPALEDLTPVEALQDIRGRVLLEGMLNDLEIMEIRAGSRGEYYYPTSVIRNKLGVEKNKPYKELLRPEAIALKVEKHRAQQRLSPYITSYNWLNDGYVQVAIVIFDRFFSQHGNEERLAWLLYMWNEFTTVYYPCVSRLTYWIEALERTFSDQPEKNYDDGNVAREFGLSTLIVSKNAYLIAGHFQRFPLDFNLAVQEYPMWADLNFHRMIQTYDEIVQYMNAYAYMMEDQWNEREQEVYCAYYDQVNQYAYFWDDFRKKVYRAFFRDHFLLDDGHTEGNSVANQLWEKQASRFPPYLREAALQMMMSFVGIYRIFPFKNKELVFVDYFTGEHHKIVGHFGDDIHDYVVPGMIILCRLLPLTGGWMWINEPFFVVLEELEPLFEKKLHIIMEEMQQNDISDPTYLKKRGTQMLKAYIISINDLENEALHLIHQPLQIKWRYAYILNQNKVADLLRGCSHFTRLYQSPDRSSFIWGRFNEERDYQWGYLLLEHNCLFLVVPPGKDIEILGRDIRKSLIGVDLIVSLQHFEPSLKYARQMERKMVIDLGEFFERNPETLVKFLRQDSLPDEDSEWMQGVFLLKLGTLLKNYLEEKHPHK